MANSPEYRTLTQHRSELVIALADELIQLSDELFARGLISGDDADTVKDLSHGTINRAFHLTGYVLHRVELNPSNYLVFIDVLSQRQAEHEDILRVLDAKYKELSEFKLMC